MKAQRGFTLVEVIVAMALLSILAAGLLTMLPIIRISTQSSSVDTTQSQRAVSIFENISYAWSNINDWQNNTVDGQALSSIAVPNGCTLQVPVQISAQVKRLEIVCAATASLPERHLYAAYGNPSK